MAKLKLKLDDYEYIEGTPEELAAFIKIAGKQPFTEKVTEVKHPVPDIEVKDTTIETEDSMKQLEDQLKDIEIISFNLPNESEVIDFIKSRVLFEHNTIELQEKFLGKRLPVRENPSLYAAFDNIVRKARKQIANELNGTWDNRGTKSFGRRTHVTVYKFKKTDDQSNQAIQDNIQKDSDTLRLNSLRNFTKVEQETIV